MLIFNYKSQSCVCFHFRYFCEIALQSNKPVENTFLLLRRRTSSSCQARPVSQNQICQSKHDIEFCNLFWKTSVSGFPELELALDYGKDMLYLGTNGRFLALLLSGFVLTAFAELLNLGGTTIDSVADFLAVFVL